MGSHPLSIHIMCFWATGCKLHSMIPSDIISADVDGGMGLRFEDLDGLTSRDLYKMPDYSIIAGRLGI